MRKFQIVPESKQTELALYPGYGKAKIMSFISMEATSVGSRCSHPSPTESP